MTKQEHIDYWLKLAADDWEFVEDLFSRGRNHWCLYHAHLALEKAIKAFWARDSGPESAAHSQACAIGRRNSLEPV